jgi:hypothetical protein
VFSAGALHSSISISISTTSIGSFAILILGLVLLVFVATVASGSPTFWLSCVRFLEPRVSGPTS